MGRFGWVFGGQIVAPASVDPYLRIMPVARRIFDACGVFSDLADRDRLLDDVLYKYNYAKSATVWSCTTSPAAASARGSVPWVPSATTRKTGSSRSLLVR